MHEHFSQIDVFYFLSFIPTYMECPMLVDPPKQCDQKVELKVAQFPQKLPKE